jgi:hypothetical protein
MEGGERDLKKRLETTATQWGGQDLKRNDEAMVVSLEAQPSGAAKERNAKLVRKKLKQEVIDLGALGRRRRRRGSGDVRAVPRLPCQNQRCLSGYMVSNLIIVPVLSN